MTLQKVVYGNGKLGGYLDKVGDLDGSIFRPTEEYHFVTPFTNKNSLSCALRIECNCK